MGVGVVGEGVVCFLVLVCGVGVCLYVFLMTMGELGVSGLLSRLGGPARSVWAKHDRDGGGWLPLWRHLEDCAAVAGLLWDEWVPASVRGLIAGVLPGGEADARALVVWLAGVHDIGKTTPTFACQVDDLAEVMRDQGLEMRSAAAMGPDRRLAPHGLAGQVLLGEWLEERHGWAAGRTGQFTVAVGGHHGVPPEHGQIKALYEHEELLRTPGPGGGCGGGSRRSCWMRVRSGSGWWSGSAAGERCGCRSLCRCC